MAEACLESWTRQTCARERLQLVVVDYGVAARRAARLRRSLAAGDLWIESRDRNESGLYDCGARSASAPLLLFTEAHCLARSIAAAETLECFRDDTLDAAVIATGHLDCDNALARMQAALELEWFAAWPPGHPRTVSLRGFAIRRDAYVELGGFRRAHERFCETAMGIAIARSGRRIGRTPALLIDHTNTTRISDLAAALASCARGQLAWREQLDVEAPGLADELLGSVRAWTQRATLMPAAARSLLRAITTSLLSDLGRRGSIARARGPLARLPLLLASALPGGSGLRCGAHVAFASSVVRWWMAQASGRALMPSYRRLWNSAFELGFIDYVTRHPIEPLWPEVTSHERAIAELPDGALAGFYNPERWIPNGALFRWTRPAAMLRLGFQPGQYTLRLSWHAPVPTNESSLKVYFNGLRVPERNVYADERSLEVRLSPEVSNPDGRQELAFTVRGFRSVTDATATDTRLLGAALFGVELSSRAEDS